MSFVRIFSVVAVAVSLFALNSCCNGCGGTAPAKDFQPVETKKFEPVYKTK